MSEITKLFIYSAALFSLVECTVPIKCFSYSERYFGGTCEEQHSHIVDFHDGFSEEMELSAIKGCIND